jgi:hypothetical protein
VQFLEKIKVITRCAMHSFLPFMNRLKEQKFFDKNIFLNTVVNIVCKFAGVSSAAIILLDKMK